MSEDLLKFENFLSSLITPMPLVGEEEDFVYGTLQNISFDSSTQISVGGRNESGEDDYVPYGERPETYIVPVLFAIIFVIGVLGNGTLVVIFLKHRTMRNVPNMYICSLAVGDLLVIFFCVPFTSTVYTVESWPYGLLVCKFSEFMKDISVGVSVFTLTALSADRYFAIVDPIRKRKITGGRANRITFLTIAGIWVLSVVLALPSVLFSYVRKFVMEDTSEETEGRTFEVCYPYPPNLGPNYPKMMVLLRFLVYYAVPLFFIATFYIIMARHLVLSTMNMPGEQGGQAKQIQARKKVAKMVLSFVVIFALCFFPSQIFALWFYFDPNSEKNFNEVWNVVRILGFCLGFTNSCINPITLYCVSGTFRKHFNAKLFCCCPCVGRVRRRGMNGGVSEGGNGGLICGCATLSNAGHVYGEQIPMRDLCRNAGHSGNQRRKYTWESQSTNATSQHNIHLALTNLPATQPTTRQEPNNFA